MLSPIEMGALATASLGSVTMLWGNIRGIFARVKSLIIVEAELQGNMGDNFMDYCWKHYRTSPLGIRIFYAGDYFVRPKNRLARVASEGGGLFVTFWKGWRPIFVLT